MDASPQTDLWALLVGVNRYASPAIPHLDGCVNDVEAMAHLLRDQFGVPAAQIRTLTDEDATRGAIAETFRTHLIETAQQWAQHPAAAPPALLFHFSGHGSQATADRTIEPDGWDETLVPYDSRLPNVYDIKDWELGAWLDVLTAPFWDATTGRYHGNVTVILDCCHSGSGTRAERQLAAVRRCVPDERPQPTRPTPHQAPQQVPERTTRAIRQTSGWFARRTRWGRYVLLAACRDQEKAYEYVAPMPRNRADEAAPGHGFRRHGALTYFLLQTLTQMPPEQPWTYRVLHEKVRHLVNTQFAQQMPQCEGDRERLVFGAQRPRHTPYWSIVEIRDGFFWINAGLLHGLAAGVELHAYPPGTDGLDTTDAIAPLRVIALHAVRSGCTSDSRTTDLPIGARVVVSRGAGTAAKRRVALAAEGRVLTALQERLQADDAAPYVDIAPGQTPADYRIELRDDNRKSPAFHLQNSAGEDLVEPVPLRALHRARRPLRAADLDALWRMLRQILRYQNALALENDDPQSLLFGQVGLEIIQLHVEPETDAMRTEPIPYSDGGELLIAAGQPVVISMINRSDRALHVALFEFGPAWQIVRLYPEQAGAHEALAPHSSLQLGLSSDPAGQIVFDLPGDASETRVTLKLLATIEDADFEMLEQDKLNVDGGARASRGRRARRDGAATWSPTPAQSSIDQLLARAVRTPSTTRRFQPGRAALEDEWTTSQIRITVVPPRAPGSN